MTSQQDIRNWFNLGIRVNATHMVVVYDLFALEDYPIFIGPAHIYNTVQAALDAIEGKDMQSVREVYNLAMERELQLSERLAWHC